MKLKIKTKKKMSCYKVKLKKNSKNNEKNQLKKLIKKS
jgi:hypothetical protein